MGSRLFPVIVLMPMFAFSANLALGAESFLPKVETKIFTMHNFRLENGVVFPKIAIAYETYGQPAGDGRNGILITHGYTSDHHAAGQLANGGKGWWDPVIGPGKSIDTKKYFVISSNMLGSCYGSTNPSSINPQTGKPYGPDFPEISMVDIVTAQQALVRHLGLKHLVAVVGPSFGGYQAFQWGVTFPDFVDGLVPVITAPKGSGGEESMKRLIDRLSTDPNWNDGWYYERGEITKVLTDMRVETLKTYGIEAQLAKTIPDPKVREDTIRKLAEPWAREFDGHSLVVLRRASVRFDAVKDFGKMRAKVLYVLSRTDKVFPPSLAEAVMAKLKAANVDAAYFEIDSENGHLASGLDAAKWSSTLRSFLESLGSSNP